MRPASGSSPFPSSGSCSSACRPPAARPCADGRTSLPHWTAVVYHGPARNGSTPGAPFGSLTWAFVDLLECCWRANAPRWSVPQPPRRPFRALIHRFRAPRAPQGRRTGGKFFFATARPNAPKAADSSHGVSRANCRALVEVARHPRPCGFGACSRPAGCGVGEAARAPACLALSTGAALSDRDPRGSEVGDVPFRRRRPSIGLVAGGQRGEPDESRARHLGRPTSSSQGPNFGGHESPAPPSHARRRRCPRRALPSPCLAPSPPVPRTAVGLEERPTKAFPVLTELSV